MVELRGLEPLTSSMPWKRATNCAKAPRERAAARPQPDRSYIRSQWRANPMTRSRALVEDEDWQPLRSVGVHKDGPQHAVEDQVHGDDVRHGSGAVEEVALNERERG